MSFMDSYKHLEKLCGEILNDDRKISAYIDEMESVSKGIFYVNNWENDLKKLKHYRWIRNKITHDPDYNESNMCNPEDEVWLDNFYSRIKNQTDPLSLYRKSLKQNNYSSNNKYEKPYISHSSNKSCSSTFIIACGIIIMFLVIFYFLLFSK